MPENDVIHHDDEFPRKAEEYELHDVIGFGAYATVYRAYVRREGRHNGVEVAVKIIDLEQFEDSALGEIHNELQVMQMFRHHNVVNYYAVFPKDQQIWLIMPLFAGGSCASVARLLLSKPGGLPEGVMAYILRETADAILYFHRNQEVHRDIKACNILMANDGKVYLSDFGMAASLRDRQKCQTFVGTPCWMAPEVLMQRTGYDYKADVWSFGITAIELAQGEAPHQRYPPLKVMRMILDNEPPRLKSTQRWDPSLSALVKACLQKDPKKRPSMEEVVRKMGKKFFAKACSAEHMREYLNALPPLEHRVPRDFRKRPISCAQQHAAVRNRSWDFSLGVDDDDDGLWALPEHE